MRAKSICQESHIGKESKPSPLLPLRCSRREGAGPVSYSYSEPQMSFYVNRPVHADAGCPQNSQNSIAAHLQEIINAFIVWIIMLSSSQIGQKHRRVWW